MRNTEKEIAMFAKVIVGVSEEFGGSPSDDNLELKFNALKEYSIEQIRQAGTWLLKNRKETFPAVPKTQEFINAIQQTTNPQLSPKAKAHEQCDIVLKYFQYYGSACDHTFKDTSTKYLMENRWSFYQLGGMKPDDLKWWRKDFVEAYQEISKPQDVELLENQKNCTIPATKLKLLAKVGV